MPISDRKQSTGFTRGIQPRRAVKGLGERRVIALCPARRPSQESLVRGPGGCPLAVFP